MRLLRFTVSNSYSLRFFQNKMSTVSKPVCDLLDPSCGVPPDVIFQIMDHDGDVLGKVEAHKTILALRVPVFLRQFFGEFPSECLVKIEDTVVSAFKMLLSHIYQAPMDWASLNLTEVFRVADLAEKYLLPCLMMKVEEHLETIAITEDNLIDTATLAEQFSLLASPSSLLLNRCAEYVMKNIKKSLFYVTELASRYCEDQDKALVVVRLLARANEKCTNCGHKICQDGKPVESKEELMEGTRLVTIGPNWMGFGPASKKGEKGTVMDLNVEDKKDLPSIMFKFDDLNASPEHKIQIVYARGMAGGLTSNSNDHPNFIFACSRLGEKMETG